MIIKHNNSDHIIDTDKIPDVDAIILEKTQDLLDTLKKYKRSGVLSIQTTNNIEDNKSSAVFYTMDLNQFNKHISSIDYWLKYMTDNQVFITNINGDTTEERNL